MDRREALSLLDQARELRFAFPSSYGNPGLEGEPLDRDRLVEAAGALNDDEADELADHAWRLWVMAPRDLEGGLRFLAGRRSPLALYGAGLLSLRTGDIAGSRRLNEQALERADTDEEIALAHLGLSRAALDDRDAATALEHALMSREAASGLGEALAGQGPRHLHAQSLRMAGRLDEALRLFEESLELNRRIGDDPMADVEEYNLGFVHLRRGDTETAVRYLSGASDDPLAAAALAYAKGDAHGATAWLEQVEAGLPVEDAAERDWLREQLAAR